MSKYDIKDAIRRAKEANAQRERYEDDVMMQKMHKEAERAARENADAKRKAWLKQQAQELLPEVDRMITEAKERYGLTPTPTEDCAI